MIALKPQEMIAVWLLSHLVLLVVPAVLGLVAGCRGRLRLWHFSALVAVVALMLPLAPVGRSVLGRPAVWPGLALALLKGWPLMLAVVAVGCVLGFLLYRSGQRGRDWQGGRAAA